ncbi:hypothetical protein [Aureispira anguillae]|uniref:Lipoprotein n=1 Tax=Aureispira anguillae TaxID=2864201 RepID=A0A915YCZ9_9BACT|nr:hypothetical protein [Aureispira anguillae]BDS10804.1 hypothetical protein AsAng_0015130 [Aureispira anguillae]
MNAKKTILRLLAPVATGAILLVACNNSSNSIEQTQVALPEENVNAEQLAVQPPIPGIDVPFKSYAVPVDKGMLIETETGTTIEIPANAFVDKDGNPIEGNVDIKFREFHDAKDIIASGIPMHNPETGEYMETAGMFEIKGAQAGKEVFVRGDKDIHVNLASFNEGDNFNFYHLGPKDCRWEDKGTAKSKPNTKKQARIAELDRQLPTRPIQARKRSNVENFVFDLDINYSMFPELKTFKGVVWEYAGEGDNPQKNDWIFTSDWDGIDLKKSETGYFELVLSNSEKSFKTLVRPVLSDENYEEALAQFSATKMEEYNKVKKAQQEERKRLGMQADLVRSFAVQGFGTYNWDIWHRRGRTRCAAKAQFDELAGVDKDVNKISFFLVMGGERSVVRYSPSTLNKFSFDANDENILLAILPEGKVAVFSALDFKNLDLDKIVRSKTALIEMATSTIQISSLDDLDQVIDQALLT